MDRRSRLIPIPHGWVLASILSWWYTFLLAVNTIFIIYLLASDKQEHTNRISQFVCELAATLREWRCLCHARATFRWAWGSAKQVLTCKVAFSLSELRAIRSFRAYHISWMGLMKHGQSIFWGNSYHEMPVPLQDGSLCRPTRRSTIAF